MTYGTFAPRRGGARFPGHAQVRADFEAMSAAGLNTVRTYTVPPADVLELAREHDLRLLVGLDYTDWRMESVPGRRAADRVLDAGRRAVAAAMEQLAERPEVLAVAVGNEVPGDIVRVHGIASVERTLSALVADVHAADRAMLACYVNFPTTEYLDVDGQDLTCFNVFLERPEALRRYLRHLQIVAGDLPLVLTELGLASEVHGEDAQATSLARQLSLVDECGLAGATVFAWTDEWNVGGGDVDGWGFGVTDRARRPKPALADLSRWARSTLRDLRETWPRISVVVCAYQAAATIDECLASLVRSDYPDLEIIVCDDGSTDGTSELARRHPVRLLEVEHGGLANARNHGIEASTGQVVAFLDADAACDRDWPYHLALSLEDDNVAATGGPNVPPADAPLVERAVAASPGGPVQVLVSDDRAEHVPGCNMAFRRDALDEIGCFDPIYTTAGDDVDVCWKLLDRGYEIAFAPAAQVLHRRRASVTAYLRQQFGYGKAERLMASRHSHRFNGVGQARWAGCIYGGPRLFGRLLRPVVYHGSMGAAQFQPVVSRRGAAALLWAGTLLPLLVPFALLGALAPLSLWWLAAPIFVVATVLTYGAAVSASARIPRTETRRVSFRLLVAAMHVTQPLVRTWGRLRAKAPDPVPQTRPPPWVGERTAWLDALARDLAGRGCNVRPSRAHDAWDLCIRRGPFIVARVTTAVHWGWTPSHRLTLRPRAAVVVAAGIAAVTAVAGTWSAAPVAPLVALALALALAVAVAVDAAVLLRTAETSLERTTTGARVPGRAETNDLDTELRRRLRPDGVPDPEFLRQPS